MGTIGPDPSIAQSCPHGEPLEIVTNEPDLFFEELKSAYKEDALYQKILANPSAHPTFTISNGFLLQKNHAGESVLCVPKHTYSKTNQSLRGMVLDSAHHILGHLGSKCTADYVRRWYWWLHIFADTESFCRSCKECQTCKSSTRAPSGKLHPLPIPQRPWKSIVMDFVGPFPEVTDQGVAYNYLWVVICRLTSVVRLIPVNTSTTASKLAWLFI
jgi:hypothetical protein